MSRVSQAQALENRRRAVAAASQLFRERGVNGISVADLMKSIGLTTGGFYKQFSSKEALVAEAAQAAFGDLDLLLASFDTAQGDHDTARGALVDFYLSAEHRDQPGTGCPTAGFAGDMAREPVAGEVRETYAAGVGHSPPGCPPTPTTAFPWWPPWSERSCSPGPPRAPNCRRRSWSRPTKP